MTKPFRRKVRQSQTLTPFGVGGLLDLRGESFVASDVRSWARYGATVEARRLAAVLGVEGFRSAPVMPDGKAKWVSTVGPGYARFPQWLFCPRCRRMSRWSTHLEQRDKVPTCTRQGCPTGTQLAPMRFVQICAAGHMGDVDWVRWAHSGHIDDAQRQCAIRNELDFEVEQHSTGLDSLAVRCARCKARRSLIGIIAKDALRSVGSVCTGRQPWQPAMEKVDCREFPQVVQRGASNVYYPSIYSSIDIPSAVGNAEDDAATEAIIDSKYWTVLCDGPNGPVADVLKSAIAEEAGTTVEAVDKLLKHTLSETASSVGRAPTGGEISQDEWTAFVNAPPELTDSGTFATEETPFDSAGDTDATRALNK